MLIINADDWGRNAQATRNALECWKKERITSASAMVFMADSERSAELALENGIDTGLHLNFTDLFDGIRRSNKLHEYHHCIAQFLCGNKYRVLIYNPLLGNAFDYVYNTQYEEYFRLYHKLPTHINGHKHMHLCMNMILAKLIPKGFRVRRNFSFRHGEKGFLNRCYRRTVDTWLTRRYKCTDFFFSLPDDEEVAKLGAIMDLAKLSNVELMVHPERSGEYNYLMSGVFQEMISGTSVGTFADLQGQDILN